MSDDQITIVCPSCQTYFHVRQDALGPQGRTVRCTVCQKVWFERNKRLTPSAAKPTPSQKLMHSQKPLRNIERTYKRTSSSYPIYKTFPEDLTYHQKVRRAPTCVKKAPLIVAAAIVLLTLFGYALYKGRHLFGGFNTNNIRILNVTWQTQKNPSGTTLTLNASVANMSDSQTALPSVDAEVISEQEGQKLSVPITLRITGSALAPGEIRPFTATAFLSQDLQISHIHCIPKY